MGIKRVRAIAEKISKKNADKIMEKYLSLNEDGRCEMKKELIELLISKK